MSIHVGEHFGAIDIVASILHNQRSLKDWILHKEILQRQFTVMAVTECELLTLGISELNRMKQEFLEAYEKIFENTIEELKTISIHRLRAMNMCEDKRVREMLTSERSGTTNKNREQVDEEPANVEDEIRYEETSSETSSVSRKQFKSFSSSSSSEVMQPNLKIETPKIM